MLIGEAVAAIGVEDDEDLDLCVTAITREGRVVNATLRSVAHRDMAGLSNVYLAGGRFERGTIAGGKGRTWANVREVMWLAFDADLTDFLDEPAETLHTQREQAWLDRRVGELAEQVQSVFDALPLPLHRLDMTGYGVCAYVMLDRADWRDLDEIKTLYPVLIRALNERAGVPLFDAQVSDAGTRITRLPGSSNHKGPTPRLVRTITQVPGSVGVRGLWALAGGTMQRRMADPAPRVGTQRLAEGMAERIVDAVTPEWTEGRRHGVALGLAGLLCKAGVTEGDTEAVVMAACRAAGDPEEYDRRRAVQTTYMEHMGGRPVRGYHRLRELIGAEALRDLDAILEPLRRATTGTITLGRTQRAADGAPESAPQFLEVPDLAWRGWIGEYMEIMAPTTEAPDAFHLGTALTVAGAAMGRRVKGRYTGANIYPNLYSLIIGNAGSSRKDHAIQAGIYWANVMVDGGYMGEHTQSPYLLLGDAGSAQALIDALAAQPNALLYLSEFARLTRNARRQGTSDLIPTLLQAFNNPPSLEVVSRANPAKAIEPCLSIIAAIQPEILSLEFGENDTASGFTSRLMYFCGAAKPEPLPDPEGPDKRALSGLYRRLLEVREAGRTLPLADDAREAWAVFYARDKARPTSNGTQDQMRTRLALMVRKVALIYAATEGCERVEREHLDAAMAVVEWQWANVCMLSVDWGALAKNVIERRVLETLRTYGAMTHHELRIRTQSPRWDADQFASVMRGMIDRGSVVQDGGYVVDLGDAARGW